MTQFQELIEKIRQYKSHSMYVKLRSQFGCMHPCEMLYHDIQFLKLEKEILKIVERESFALVALDNDPEIRSVFDSFIKGKITSQFMINGQVAWEPLYDHIDRTIEEIQQRYDQSEELNRQIANLERKRKTLSRNNEGIEIREKV